MSERHTPTRDRYVILIRNPRSRRVMIISKVDDEGFAAIFKSEEAAQKAASTIGSIVAGWPYSIVRAP